MKRRDHERILRAAIAERETVIAARERVIERQRTELDAAYQEIERLGNRVAFGDET